MAETLLGTHRRVVCGDCRWQFNSDADVPAIGQTATCPNCGYDENRLENLPIQAGDRLLMHKSVLRIRQPRRWEVVALRHPLRSQTAVVKRVVGLPGELVQVVSGDVYINGLIQRKPLARQRSMAILVHEADFHPALDAQYEPRWKGEQADSRWGSSQGRFARPETPSHEEIDWLVYHHRDGSVGGGGENGRKDPIVDRCGYNQSLSRRVEEVSQVSDLLLSLRLVNTVGRGCLWIRASTGSKEFRLRIDPNAGEWEVEENGHSAAVAKGRLPAWTDQLGIEVSLVDACFRLAFDGRQEFARNFDPPAGPKRANLSPLAIGASGLGLEIRDVRVYRDVYYTHPVGVQARWGLDKPVRLAEDEYFVLGDNSPVSQDSRIWGCGPAVSADLLMGKPVVVHFPAFTVRLGGWEFQVPDPAKIRYIR